MKPHRHFLLAGSLSLCSLISYPVYAQIVPDGTLGTERSTVVPNLTIRGIPSDRIDGGAVRGINLFHSFLDFNVSAGRGVYFSNPVGVQNILSRVTGNNPSNILGRLGVLGNANLYLLNPNGIVFGPNASLDVTGSFVASTASAIRLGNGVYSATAPQTSTLLAVQPDALFLNALGNQRGDIRNDGNLAVPPGQSLTLFGSTVTSTGTLQAAGGTVQMLGDRVALQNNAIVNVSSASGGGTVRLGVAPQGSTIPNAISTVVAPTATVNASALNLGNGGRVIVGSSTLTQIDGSISVQGGPLGGNGGLVETSSLGILNVTTIPNIAAPSGVGGIWQITPANLQVVPGTGISTANNLTSVGVDTLRAALVQGNVTLATSNPTVPQAGDITLATALDYNGVGVGKTLSLNAQNNVLINGAILDSIGGGDSLNLVLNGDINGDGFGNVLVSQSLATQGGVIRINSHYATNTTRGTLSQGVAVFAPINSGGGEIAINGRSNSNPGILIRNPIDSGGGNVTLDGSSTGPGDFARGIDVLSVNSRGGTIKFTGFSANAEGIVNFGPIDSGSGDITFIGQSTGTGTFARGIATVSSIISGGGNILFEGTGSSLGISSFIDTIDAGTGNIKFISNGPFATFNTRINRDNTSASGGGSIEITAPSIYLGNVQITASTSGVGAGTSVLLNATSGNVTIDDRSSIRTTVNPGATGSGGSITIRGGSITNLGTLEAGTAGFGNSGEIFLQSTGQIDLAGTIKTSVAPGASGKAGQIFINGNSIISRGTLEATTSGSGAGGLIYLSGNTVNLTGGTITTNVETGATGSGGLIGVLGNTITSAANLEATTRGEGAGGRIFFSGNTVNLTGGTIATNVETGATGSGGRIEVRGNTITSAANLEATTIGSGAGGRIVFDGDAVNLAGTIKTTTQSSSPGGIGGDVVITGNTIKSTADLDATTSGEAAGGNVTFTATDAVDLGGFITTNTSSSSPDGVGGNITIQGKTIRSTADLDATTSGEAAGGNVLLTATGAVNLSGGGISTTTESDSRNGMGGSITVQGSTIAVQGNGTDNVEIDASTFGTAKGGNVLFVASDAVNLGSGSSITTDVNSAATGSGGSITIWSNSLSAKEGLVSARTSSNSKDGIGGNIDLNIRTLSITDGAVFTTTTQGTAAGGSIRVGKSVAPDGSVTSNADRVDILRGAQLIATTTGSGDAGSINVGANRINISGVDAQPGSNQISDQGVARSGLFATSSGRGKAGSVLLVGGEVTLSDRAFISTSPTSTGRSGDILVNVESLSLSGGAQLATSSTGSSRAGSITVNATRSVTLQGTNTGLFASTQIPEARNFAVLETNDAGQLLSTAQLLGATGPGFSVTNFSIFGSLSNGNDVDLYRINLTGTQPFSATTVGGASFDTRLMLFDANGLGVYANDDASIDTLQSTLPATNRLTPSTPGTYYLAISKYANSPLSATGLIFDFDNSEFEEVLGPTGSGSNFPLSDWDNSGFGLGGEYAITLTGAVATIPEQAQKPAGGGNISIRTGNLTIKDGAKASADSRGGGQAGNLSVNAESIQLQNGGGLFAQATGNADAGNLKIFTSELTVANGSFVSASAESGKGGDLNIQSAQFVKLRGGGGLFAQATGAASAGNLEIFTGKLIVDDDAGATVSNTGSGQAGRLFVQASSIEIADGGRLSANTNSGSGGDIVIYVGEPFPLSDGQVSASAFFKQGKTNATGNTIKISNGGVISTSTESGRAGSIFIQGNNLVIEDDRGRRVTDRDRSRITSISTGSGTAGKIDIKLSNLLASTGGVISASAEGGGSGGQIDITAKYIFLTKSSLIQSLVSKGGGDGGDITIRVGSQFIALNDSDILATAIDGNGGNIEIKPALGIRSIAFIADVFAPVQPNSGNLERYRNNGQVNISASSDFGVSGTVSTPDFSFLQNNLTELANQLAGAERLISDRCIANRNQSQGSFVVTGTGGLPASPYDAIRGSYSASGVQQLNGQSVEMSVPAVSIKPDWQPGQPIQEASGMAITPDGKIVLGTDSQLSSVQDTWDFICRHSSVPPRSAKLVANN